MDFKNMTKEQKQYIALGAILMVALIAITTIGIKLSLSSITAARLELDDLTQKIESADRALAKQSRVRKEFAATMASLKEHLQNIPPDRNYYSWATETIHAKARMAGLEVDVVDEMERSSSAPKSTSAQNMKLESYSLLVTAHGSYETLKQFLALIEREHPLVRVTGIDISTGKDPEIHDMKLGIQWPFNLSTLTEVWKNIDVKQLPSSGLDQAAGAPVDSASPTPPQSPSSAANQSS